LLFDDDITVSNNQLRKVCCGMGQNPAEIISSGTMQVEGSVEKRRTEAAN